MPPAPRQGLQHPQALHALAPSPRITEDDQKTRTYPRASAGVGEEGATASPPSLGGHPNMKIVSEVTVTWPEASVVLCWAAGPTLLGRRTSLIVRRGACPIKGHPARWRPNLTLNWASDTNPFPCPWRCNKPLDWAAPGRAPLDTRGTAVLKDRAAPGPQLAKETPWAWFSVSRSGELCQLQAPNHRV